MAEKQSFETAMAELEDCVAKLSAEGVTLEESLKIYGDGVKLADYCKKALLKAELKVSALRESSDKDK